MTRFTDTQAHRIASIAAEHVHAQQHAKAAYAVAEAVASTDLIGHARAYCELYLAAARVDESWGNLVGAVLEAEGDNAKQGRQCGT
jgi:hypothetical protein